MASRGMEKNHDLKTDRVLNHIQVLSPYLLYWKVKKCKTCRRKNKKLKTKGLTVQNGSERHVWG